MVHANRLFCRVDGLSSEMREQQRVDALDSLGLRETAAVPVFDEATQTAARFIETPVCILGLMVYDELWLKSAVGLSRLGLMNPIAAQRRISRQEAFCTYVIESEQSLIIENALHDAVLSRIGLVQHYGIRAYLGTPLFTATGRCIGTLSVMDLEPRSFTERELEFLALTARWCLREFERDCLLKVTSKEAPATEDFKLSAAISSDKLEKSSETDLDSTEALSPPALQNDHFQAINEIKVKLLEQLTEKLRSPLTSVIGMASILRQEVYGGLTTKQKEYLEIIHGSGQQMLALMEEIVSLGNLSDETSPLELSSVDVGMLCQQTVNRLLPDAKQQQQELCLTVEQGNRVWFLDKEKVYQALYYLVACIIDFAEADSQINIHVSHNSHLEFAVWEFHPWLRSTPNAKLSQLVASIMVSAEAIAEDTANSAVLTSSMLFARGQAKDFNLADSNSNLLGLLLSCRLVELHGGKIIVQQSPQSGYSYVMQLPKIGKEDCH